MSARRWVWAAAAGLLVLGLAAGAALISRPLPRSPRGPEPGRTLFQAHCATCHGAAGRGDSWRARLLLLQPGDLSSPAMASLSDRYLADLIRHGGSSFGKPGMPSFGFVLSDPEIEAVIQYVRTLPRTPRDVARRGNAGTSPLAAGAGPKDDRNRKLGGRARRDPLVPRVPMHSSKTVSLQGSTRVV